MGGPCIATKVFCAVFMGKSRWVIGWAMVGRAEFAYLIAQMGLAGGMMDQKLFSIVIWALLWATVFAPLVFTRVLKQFIKNNSSDFSPEVSQGQSHAAHDIESDVQLHRRPGILSSVLGYPVAMPTRLRRLKGSST